MAFNTPPEIMTPFANSALAKNNFSTIRLLIYSGLGGAFIGLGGLLAIMVAGGMPGFAIENPGLVKFVFGAVFPLGLFLVIIGGAELFTSDCAVISLSVFRQELTLKNLVRIWSLVYLGNFVGALLISYLFGYQSGILDNEPWLTATLNIGEAKTSAPFIKTFIKGIGANWLVCMAVWMSYAAKDIIGKMLIIWFPVMAFVVMGFEHSIANMFFLPTAIFLGADFGMEALFFKNLLPSTLGNIVGGVVFVAFAYHYIFFANTSKTKNPILQKPLSKTTIDQIEHINFKSNIKIKDKSYDRNESRTKEVV